jgi:uncharacterized protein
MVGRQEELAQINQLLRAKQSSFISVLGRRRVGKTFLVDTAFKNHICFRLTGIQDGSTKVQLENFNRKLYEYSKPQFISTTPANWGEAFFQLKGYLQRLPKNAKQAIFLDELPWINTAKSGFLQQLAHLWNDYLSKEKHFILIVCGSASSWLLKNIVNDKGGLHNRLTSTIQLQPFTLAETKEFLLSKRIKVSNAELAEIYMTFGGVPHYLNQLQKGESFADGIERICFLENSILKNEYQNLYKALFTNASNHEKIVAALSNSQKGMLRSQILAKSKVQDGGPFNRAMNELLQCGFIRTVVQFGQKKREELYKMNDEFSVFYHKFMRPLKGYMHGNWQRLVTGQSYKIKLGLCFELLVLKHIPQLRQKLKLNNTLCTLATYYNTAKNGLQIDLLIDRDDKVINYCEIKFYASPYEVTETILNRELQKLERFLEATKTNKRVIYTLITNASIVHNEYSHELIDKVITLDDFFC